MFVSGVTEAPPLPSSDLSIDRSPPTSAISASTGDNSFQDVLFDTVKQANQADHIAAEKVDALASGAGDDLHGTMIAVKEADISMKLLGTIRNKLLDAFTEIWKTSV